jgi:hypothetical protein
MNLTAFRNVSGSPSDPVVTWPYEGLVEVLERGLLPDWLPLIREIRRLPWGETARRVEEYVSTTEDSRLRALFLAIVHEAREQCEAREREDVAKRVRDAIELSGLSQAAFAKAMGTSASRLSTYLCGSVIPSGALLVRMERLAPLLAEQTRTLSAVRS